MAEFDLTDGIDDVLGTAGNDVITGGANTLETGDFIDGGAGEDFLRAGVLQNGIQSPTISNVEVIRIDTGGLAFDIGNITGADRIYTEGASVVLQTVDTDDLDIRFGAVEVGSGTVDIDFADGALESGSDKLKLAAINSNVTFTSDSTFDGTEDGEANATEDRLRVEEIDLILAGEATGGGQFANQVDISDFSQITRLVVADQPGTGESKITVSSTELELIKLAGTTGGITVSSDTATDQRVIGGSGNDTITTGTGSDAIDAGDGDDVLFAGGGDNFLFGGDGDDEITTEAGMDQIGGGDGDDTIDSGSGDDMINAGAGNDDVTAGDGADRIFGGDGNDTINGGGGADRIRDGAGNDTVRAGNDDDTLFAGEGDDTLFGEGGVDRFIFRGTTGTDTVEDFTLTSDAATNDSVLFEFDGSLVGLKSQEEFEQFYDDNVASGRITADAGADTVTIQADSGTFTLKVSDADFLVD